MANFCPNCGSPLTGSPRFCTECGARVADTPREAGQGPQDPPSAPAVPPVQRPQIQQPFAEHGAPGGSRTYAGQEGSAFGAGAGSYVPDEGISQVFFRHDNRLNRKRYIKRSMALFAVLVVVVFVISLVLAIVGVSDAAIEGIGTLLGIAFAVPGLMLSVRRLHDLDRPTWWIIGNFIPFLNCALGLYLLFARGTYGPNQYGPDPLEGQP